MKTTKTSEIVTKVSNRKSTYANRRNNRSKLKSSFSVEDLDLGYSGYGGFGSGVGEVYFGGHYYYVA